MVFDKTGTLTTGKFVIASYKAFIDEEEFKRIVFLRGEIFQSPNYQSYCWSLVTEKQPAIQRAKLTGRE